jgi:hypothetical protein
MDNPPQTMEDAQKRLARALGQSRGDPQAYIFPAYANGVLQSAKVAALLEYFAADPSVKAVMDLLIVGQLNRICEGIEQAQVQPKILVPNGRAN